jgi:hypothetical protein
MAVVDGVGCLAAVLVFVWLLWRDSDDGDDE